MKKRILIILLNIFIVLFLVACELNEIKKGWQNHLDFVHVDTPDELINTFFNVWHQYQCAMTFNWSRFISYYERGVDRGWGFRDSMQDILGVVHAMPEKVKERIKTLLKYGYLALLGARDTPLLHNRTLFRRLRLYMSLNRSIR
jgi:hypothetical protein